MEKKNKKTGYDLTRAWFNFKFEDPQKVRSGHTELFFYIVDLWNRLGQKEKFGLPTAVTMETLGIGSYNTYKKLLNDLVDFGFILIVSKSKNQYQSKRIAISNIDKATDEALDKAHIKALDEAPDKATDEALDSIDKQLTTNNSTTKQLNNTLLKKEPKETQSEIINFENLKKVFNEKLPMLTQIQKISEQRKSAILARLKEYEPYNPEVFFESIFEKVCQSDFLIGNNDKGWKADFDWIIKKANFLKILEGTYKNSKKINTGITKNRPDLEPTINRQTADTIRRNSEGW